MATKKSKLEKLYIKYLIKSPVLFYTFIILGVVCFISISLATIVGTTDGNISLLKLIIKAGKG